MSEVASTPVLVSSPGAAQPALEGTSGERRHRVLGRLPADLGYEPIAESVAPVVRSSGPALAELLRRERHVVMPALR